MITEPNANQIKILDAMLGLYNLGESYYPYRAIKVDLPPKELRREMKGLREMGLTEYARGLMTEEGEVAGSGYTIPYDKIGEVEKIVHKHKKSYYFTFGQVHTHAHMGNTLDKDCVVEIRANSSEDARKKMMLEFGQKWSMQYDELPDMSFYPRGVFRI